jgi:hypothetical protein
MKLTLLLGKHKTEEIGAVYCKNSLRMVKLERRLYGDFFLTDIGIFKFRFQGWYRSMKMYNCNVILPLHLNQEVMRE